jgi:hypothetical protein
LCYRTIESFGTDLVNSDLRKTGIVIVWFLWLLNAEINDDNIFVTFNTLPPNGLHYWQVGGRGQGSLYRKRSGVESSSFGGTNPTSRVHAVLGGEVLLHAGC